MRLSRLQPSLITLRLDDDAHSIVIHLLGSTVKLYKRQLFYKPLNANLIYCLCNTGASRYTKPFGTRNKEQGKRRRRFSVGSILHYFGMASNPSCLGWRGLNERPLRYEGRQKLIQKGLSLDVPASTEEAAGFARLNWPTSLTQFGRPLCSQMLGAVGSDQRSGPHQRDRVRGSWQCAKGPK
jgi:hypothetical protein